MRSGPEAQPEHWKCANCISSGTMAVSEFSNRTACKLNPVPIRKEPDDFCIRDFRTTWPGASTEDD